MYSAAAAARDLGDDTKDVIVATDGERQGRIIGFAYLARGSSSPSRVVDDDDAVPLLREVSLVSYSAT